ncbi:MAG TPA: hypothetical protein VNS63_12200, partial [Blastocatellia bacterium]|nr:hypothetical protein [Blastocatellia bacterium]
MNKVRQFTFNHRASCRWPVKTSSLVTALLIVWFLVDGRPPLQANVDGSGETRATVVRARSRIIIDGLLNEPDWLEAIPV